VLHCDHAATERLITAPGVDFVAFTGSVDAGRAVARAAAQRFLGSNLELGGKDPAYVRPDADLAFAVAELVDGAFFNAGQSCCGIERIYVHRDVYEPFVEQYAALVRRYVLGDPMAPWHGGSASLTTEFIKKYPGETKRFIAAYARGIDLVRNKPDEARQFMKGYTAIDGALTSEVPLASYMLYNEFKASDIAYFQKFYDLFSEKNIFEKRVLVEPMLFKG